MTRLAPTVTAPASLDDIQGLLRFGYKHLTRAGFLLLRVKDRQAARAWLAGVPIASAAPVTPLPPAVLQVALSSEGLRALGVAGDIVNAFSPEFVSGMGDASRARRLGDVGANEPSRWSWGTGQRMPHVLVLLYALPGQFASWQRDVETGLEAGFDLVARLASDGLRGTEPFGFADGISQPRLDWERRRPAHDAEQLSYTNLCCLGEFLLGCPNEYGQYTERPLIDPRRDEEAWLPRAEDVPELSDLGRNGSYLVMRQLRQDVGGFWRYVDRQAAGDVQRREKLAAAMVGRSLQGEPLVERTHAPGIDPADLNAFDYRSDPQGLRCPLGAHVRRTNPRNADLPPGEPGVLSWLARTLGFDPSALDQDRVASTRFHRLLRRGRTYGAVVPLAHALAAPSSEAEDTGLHFICLGANIARQFEFVQAAWVAATHFDALPNESDPLLGTRQPAADGRPSDGFSMPQPQGPEQRLTGLPQFVTVLGGAYFFMPGIRALRYLAKAR